MKLKVEFDEQDLQEMFTTFFKDAGFKVLNLDELCAEFGGNWPEGIEVQVEPALVEAIPDEPEASTETPSLISLSGLETDSPIESLEEKPVASNSMSLTDLMDPSHRGDISEINKLVHTSESLKKTDEDAE